MEPPPNMEIFRHFLSILKAVGQPYRHETKGTQAHQIHLKGVYPCLDILTDTIANRLTDLIEGKASLHLAKLKRNHFLSVGIDQGVLEAPKKASQEAQILVGSKAIHQNGKRAGNQDKNAIKETGQLAAVVVH